MNKPSPRIRLLIVLAAAAAGVGAWLFLSGRVGRRRPPSNAITLYGNVDIRQVELGFRVAGRIQSMLWKRGSR